MFPNLSEYVEHVMIKFSDADDHTKTCDDSATTLIALDCDIGTVNWYLYSW